MATRRYGWSWTDWVLNPLRTSRAVHYGRGPTIPDGDPRLEPRARRYREKLLEADALGRAAREVRAYARPFGLFVWRVARRCRNATRGLDRADSAVHDAWPIGVRFTGRGVPRRRVRGEVLTTTAANEELTRLTAVVERETAAGSADHERAKGSLAAAYLILGVDSVGLFMVFSLLLNVAIAPGVISDWRRLATAMAFSVFGAGALAVAAHQLGERAWKRRHELRRSGADDERPTIAGLVGLAITVVAVSASAAASIATRVVAEGVKIATPWWLLAPAAALVSAAALAAPWLIVGHRASDGSWETRRIDLLSRAVAVRLAVNRRLVERATRDRDVARHVRDRALRAYEIVMLECEGFYNAAHAEIIAGRHGVCSEGLCPPNPGTEGTPRDTVLPVQTPMNPNCLLQAIEQMNAHLASLELRLSGIPKTPPGEDYRLAG